MKPSLASVFVAIAGLLGAGGVAGAAYAAHGADDTHMVASASSIALVHAPALLALASARRETLRLALPAAILLAIGTILFSGDLTMRTFWGVRLFPYAAPTGGMAMIAGWLVVAIGGITARLSR
ncbi:DUF423 domain-containing protein [Consotaella aegiceratis]|uniref:DUF423 domain-containing protein n=1 Tax=Consotaella aegiceratis TaxID=3097961 RepID=UPI002F40E26C